MLADYLPNSWPQPIASWQFCNHFDATIRNSFLPFSGQASRTYGVDNRSVSNVAGDNAISWNIATAAAITCKIEGIAIKQLITRNTSSVKGKCWYDMQASVRDVRV